jgi:hypothetical protein
MRDACYVIVLEMEDSPFDADNTQYETSRSTYHDNLEAKQDG